MYDRPPHKVIKVGNSLAIVVPSEVVRALGVRAGDLYDLVIGENYKIIATRLMRTPSGSFEAITTAPDKLLNYGK